MDDVDVFLAHYGVKGMKWGVSREVKETRKEARKVGRKALNEAYLAKYGLKTRKNPTGQSGGKVVADALLNMATIGSVTSLHIARSAGYSKGKSAAFLMLGPFGGIAAQELKLRTTVNAKIK